MHVIGQRQDHFTINKHRVMYYITRLGDPWKRWTANARVQRLHTVTAWNNNEGGRYLMVTDKPLRPRSCAGPIRAGVRRRDIPRHMECTLLLKQVCFRSYTAGIWIQGTHQSRH